MATTERTVVRRVPLGNLRLRSRVLAEGLYAGQHRSQRRGAGIEFAGFREYSPGDDLRRLDWRALFRFDRLLLREFETETDRSIEFVVDASRSMSYKGDHPESKYGYAALLASALARLAVTGGDPVGLALLGSDVPPVRSGRGIEGVERMIATFEREELSNDVASDEAKMRKSLEWLFYRQRRGSLCFFFSDLLDLPSGAIELASRLATGGRRLIVVQVLDPDEIAFPFKSAALLRSMEGNIERQITGADDGDAYRAALHALQENWRWKLESKTSALVLSSTAEEPIEVARRILRAVR